MAEVNYFAYDVDSAIECLTGQGLGLLNGQGTDELSLGCFVLFSYLDCVPDALHMPVRNKVVDISFSDAAWLCDRLKRLSPETGSWVDVQNDGNVGVFFRGLKDLPEMSTLQFLSMSYYLQMHQQDQVFPDTAVVGAVQLLNKFEVYGRIFSKYNSQFRKQGNDFDNLLNYIFLSLVLLNQYHHTGQLQFLNAALKVNDLLMSAISFIRSPVDVLTALAALCYGKFQVERLYEDRGFRMPAD